MKNIGEFEEVLTVIITSIYQSGIRAISKKYRDLTSKIYLISMESTVPHRDHLGST